MAPPDASAGPNRSKPDVGAQRWCGQAPNWTATGVNDQAPYYRTHAELVPLYVPEGNTKGFSLPAAGTVLEGLE